MNNGVIVGALIGFTISIVTDAIRDITSLFILNNELDFDEESVKAAKELQSMTLARRVTIYLRNTSIFGIISGIVYVVF